MFLIFLWVSSYRKRSWSSLLSFLEYGNFEKCSTHCCDGITFDVLDLVAPRSDFKQFSIFSKFWQFLNILCLPLLFTYFNHVFITLFNFVVLAHYVKVFWIVLKELSNSGKFFSQKSTVLTILRFFGFLIHLTSVFNSKSFITTPWYDISVKCLTVFWIALVLLDCSKSNLSFPNFSWVSFWFSKEWNKTAPLLSHLYVFGWLSTFPFLNVTRELLKVAVIGTCLESKLGERTLKFIIFFIRGILETR